MRPSRTLPKSRVTIGSGAGAPDVDDIEKLEAIRDVMEYAAHVTIQTALAKPMRSVRARPIGLAILAVLSLAVAAFTFVAEPDWVFGPAPTGAAVEEQDAHLRYAMFLAAQRIESLRDSTTGEAPASLAAIGEDWSGFGYQVLELGDFELRGRLASGDDIVYKSGESLGALAQDARPWLRVRPR
jgi:hypothetical protein